MLPERIFFLTREPLEVLRWKLGTVNKLGTFLVCLFESHLLQLLRLREWFILVLCLVYRAITWHSKTTSLFFRLEAWFDVDLKHVSLIRKDYQWRHSLFSDLAKISVWPLNYTEVKWPICYMSSFAIISQGKSLVEISTWYYV